MTKPNPENCTNCSSKCAYDCAQLQYTIQHRAVMIISPLTSIAQMLSIGGQGLPITIAKSIVVSNANTAFEKYFQY